MKVLGVDIGVSPALALLDTQTSKVVTHLRVPLRADGHMNEAAVCAAIRRMKPDLVITEKLQAFPQQGASSGFNFGFSWGLVIGAARARKAEVLVVRPVEWKKMLEECGYSMGPPRPVRGTKLTKAQKKELDLARKTAQKEAAIAYSRKHHPEVALVYGRKRNPDHDLADAVCLADYGATVYELDRGG